MKTQKSIHYIFIAALAALACIFFTSQAAMAQLNGISNCVSSPETCNGIDDDCNGLVDDHPAVPGDSAGACANWKCVKGSWTKEAVSAGQICRDSVGPCDIIDRCDGVQAGCPADEVAPASRPCREANGLCDKAEYCTGSSAICPAADEYLPAGTGCSDGNSCTSNDVCQAGSCSGTLKTCPAGNACQGPSTCNPATGLCEAGAAIICADDGKPCTIESCNVNLGGCQHTPKTCAPEDKCHEAGTCDPTNGECGTGRPKICPALDACHKASTCNPANGTCVEGDDISCDDGDPCTVDSCNAVEGCKHVAMACNDWNDCTTDFCKAGACIYQPIANCGGGGDGCTPGNVRICEGLGIGGCYAKQICLPGGAWGECMFNTGVACEDLASRDDCAITTSGRCTEAGACAYTQTQNLCVNSDGCCPDGCNSLNDNNCNAFCGNAVVEEGEICEAASSVPDEICLARCDDGDVSTRDTMSGSAGTCDVQCQFTLITECASGDGYCPEGCVFATDSDCPADEVVAEEMERGEEIILPAANAGVEFFSFCDGASEATKQLNGEIKAIVGSSKVDLFCDYDARMIYIVMSKDDPLTRTWALIQKSGLPVLWADQYWKNPRYESVSTPVVIFSSKNNPAIKSMTESMLSLSVPDYVEPVSNVKVTEDKPDRINYDNFVTYYSSVETDPSLTLANGDVVEFSRSAEEIAADNKYKQVFTVAFLKPSSFNTVGGPINPINEEDKLRDAEGVKKIMSEKASAGQFDWNSIKAEDFSGVWQQEDVESFKVVGPTGEGGEISLNTIVGNRVEGGPSCALLSIKGMDLPAAIIILLLIAILPAATLSLARAVVKSRKKSSF